MHTLVKAVFADSRRLTAMTALPLFACLLYAGVADAQQPQPPFGPPPPSAQPAPGQSPFGPQPAPSQPPPGQWGQQPAPGQWGQQPPPGQWGQQPAPGQWGQQPPPGQWGQQPPPGQWGQQPQQPPPGQPGFGVSGELKTNIEAPPVPEEPAAPVDEDEERALSLMEQSNLYGSTGLLRTSYAGSGAPGTFRVGFNFDWFKSSNFLCDPDNTTLAGVPTTCGANNAADAASHVGAFFALSATPLSFLEGYAALRTYANSNDQGRPQLLQVLGDTIFGVKAFTPNRLGKIFTFGGEAQLHLLNGTGDVGIAGGGTSALFRALASADFRKPGGKGFPLRINLNLGYKLDNSGKLVEDVELRRAEARGLQNDPATDPDPARLPITRIERFGLGINKVDTFQTYLGVEMPFSKVQPYVEYSLDIPVNRQGYTCHTGRVSKGDVCLGLDDFSSPTPESQGGPGFKAFPSRLSLGVRTNPFNKAFRGLSAHVGFDIGLTGTSTFIEELAPQAPWTLYVGLGYAFDTKVKEPAPPPEPKIVEKTKEVEKPQTFVRGVVHEQGKPEVLVADAIVSFQSGAEPPLATGVDGKFLTRHLEPGTYTFNIKAEGYKPGTCEAKVAAPGAAPAAPAPQPAQPGQPAPFGAQPFGAQPGPFGPGVQGMPGMQPAMPGMQPGMPGQAQPGMPGTPPAPAAPEAPKGPSYVEIDCALEALPKLGNISGTVKESDSGAPVGGAVVQLTDASGQSKTVTADGNGAFSFKDVPPGEASLKAEASGYMVHVEQTQVKANEEARPTLSMNKRPKISLVKVQGNEIKIKKQVHFETDSSKILGDSNALLEEIAEVMLKTSGIKKVEIQGHTDNTGTRQHNLELSDARANAVKSWLVRAGVAEDRLVAKGYGQDKPLAPNVTAANRAKNRRVQFIILEKN